MFKLFQFKIILNKTLVQNLEFQSEEYVKT